MKKPVLSLGTGKWKPSASFHPFFRFFKSFLSQRKLIFSSAQAARAPSFSAARERRQRERKGRCGGSSKLAREVCRLKISGSARSTRRHTSVAPLTQFFILPPLENPANGFQNRKLWAGVGAEERWRQQAPSTGAESNPYRIAIVRPLLQ